MWKQVRISAICLCVLVSYCRFARAAEPVRVFILAGQSNMEGHGFIPAEANRNGGQGSLEFLSTDPVSRERFGILRREDGAWRERDDVWIHYLDRKGSLKAGFGVREDRIGPELGFGWVLGDHFKEPVLLIKLAWGGKSLAQDFRPPSAGGEVGPYYHEVVNRTKSVLASIDTELPDLRGSELKLTGFGWHQGWNDRINQSFNDEHESNLTHFIHDIRRDLDVPELPFVIAETGMTGPEEKHPRALSLMQAQRAVTEHEEFRGNVAFVPTQEFWRPADQSPGQQGYHWNSNAETYYLIGDAMGKSMLRLLDAP